VQGISEAWQLVARTLGNFVAEISPEELLSFLELLNGLERM